MTKRDLQNQIDALREQIIMANGRIRALEYDFNMQTADVVERKKGKWLESNESIIRPYMCSNCGCLYDVDTIMGKLCWNFCPNCGARMDERKDDD